MLEFIQIIGPIILGLVGLLAGFIYNHRMLKQKQYEDERKEIYKKLNSFYGPFTYLRGISRELYQRFRASRGEDFRTLIVLLEGEKFENNDKILIEQIIEVSKRLSETGWSWGDGPGTGVPASASVWPEPAEAGTPGALSGVAGHPACRGTDAHQLFRRFLKS